MGDESEGVRVGDESEGVRVGDESEGVQVGDERGAVTVCVCMCTYARVCECSVLFGFYVPFR